MKVNVLLIFKNEAWFRGKKRGFIRIPNINGKASKTV